MTEVAFHFNAPDKIGYACRLLRKAVVSGAHVVVVGDDALLRELDVALWTFAPQAFLPHCLMQGSDATLIAASPILLGSPAASPQNDVLVNLGTDLPDAFERYVRLIEVVTGESDDRAAARRRWRHYADHGYALMRHDLAGAGA
ncbi:MAG: DNA polymerase III subunit chi [Rhodoferax sp.]